MIKKDQLTLKKKKFSFFKNRLKKLQLHHFDLLKILA